MFFYDSRNGIKQVDNLLLPNFLTTARSCFKTVYYGVDDRSSNCMWGLGGVQKLNRISRRETPIINFASLDPILGNFSYPFQGSEDRETTHGRFAAQNTVKQIHDFERYHGIISQENLKNTHFLHIWDIFQSF